MIRFNSAQGAIFMGAQREIGLLLGKDHVFLFRHERRSV